MEESVESLSNNVAKKLTFDDSLNDSKNLIDNDDNESLNEPEEENGEIGTQEVWKWWEEEQTNDGILWETLEHKGPAFPRPYEPFRFLYGGHEIGLSPAAEEMAAMYAQKLDHEYKDQDAKDRFNNNFFNDWKLVLTEKDKAKINKFIKEGDVMEFKSCDFSKMHAFYQNILPENKKRLRAKEEEEHGYCIINGRWKERVKNFRINSPDLCRASGKKSKPGALRKRVMPEDVTINCSPGKAPAPPPGHQWKAVIHDNTAYWLASWKNSLGQITYMMFHLNSSINAKSDYKKFEQARQLHKELGKIKEQYEKDWKLDKPLMERQRAVAAYFIDKLVVRVGNESDATDAVGACSLRVEHIHLSHSEPDNKYKVILSFKGKKNIDDYKEITVEELVYKNLQNFKRNNAGQEKADGEKLFDQLTTQNLDGYLKKQMPGLTAKVFRTYHASKIFEKELEAVTRSLQAPGAKPHTLQEKIDLYENANVAVANLCNHVRTPKKILKKDISRSQQVMYVPGTETSKEYYNDPRITAAWCNNDIVKVPIDNVFTKGQLEKFKWAIEMVKTNPNFEFAPKIKA